MPKHYMVTAFPETGHEQVWRAKNRFTRTPVQVTVLDHDDPDGAEVKHPDYELTPKMFRQVKDDLRLKVENSSGKPVNETAKAEAAAQAAADEPAAHAHPKR